MPGKASSSASEAEFRFSLPLRVGDAIPNYHFTNQVGRPISLQDFRGQALAITFIYTRCPYPNFCPRMSNRFLDAQRKLKARPGGLV